MSRLFPVLCFFSCLIAAHSFAGSATWSANPVSGDWNTAANWTPATVPNGPGDTATFLTSNLTDLLIDGEIELNGLELQRTSSTYTFTVAPVDATTVSLT